MRPKTIARLAVALPFVVALVLPFASCGGTGGGNPAGPSTPGAATLEQQTHVQVNAYRASKGLAPLAWSDVIADQARLHSQSMASGATPPGHDGFNERIAIIAQRIPWSGAAENVAVMTNQANPVTVAVDGWLNSPDHRENIEGNYDLTGIGVATAGNGTYFTQIFIKAR